MMRAFVVSAILFGTFVPIGASAQVFGEIPSTFGPTSAVSGRSGQWSIRPFGKLGNGYPAIRTGRQPLQSTYNGRFGPLPRYVREGMFGYIPSLSDLFGE
ncbi:MAG: hypothetical protein PHO92_00945 [Candidatus Peribacteraceae bacterium]|nr:hypothetical protein [Candidatus Peribacteraceae bacterium]